MARTMFSLAHFSDPHLGPLPNPKLAQLLSKRVFGYVNWTRNRAKSFSDHYLRALLADMQSQDPDHIALTGDLVNIALPDEISRAGQWLEDLAPPDILSAIPGNHDAYVRGALKLASAKWGAYMSGDDAAKTNPIAQFPYHRQRGNIAIIGLSTAISTAPFMATGALHKRQRDELALLLDKTRDSFRVILIHHPPFLRATPGYKRLRDAKQFRDIIHQHGAELILHGHTHLNTNKHIEGPQGLVPVIGVSSASNGAGNHHPAGCYNLFSIEQTGNSWTTTMQKRGILDKNATIGFLGEPTQII